MSLVADPNILTKDRLREELQKHNVTLPRSDSKKSVYVDIYKRELLDKREKLEFSSDDEIEFSSSRRKKKPGTPVKKLSITMRKTPVKTPSKVMKSSQDVDVTALTDAELSQQLRDLGISVGPIMESTRKIYQRKLEKLRAEALKEPPPVIIKASAALADTLPLPDEFSDNTQDEEEEEEEPEPVPEPPRPKLTFTKKSPSRSEKFEFRRMPLKARTTRSTEEFREFNDQVDYSPFNSSNNTNIITRRYKEQETNSITDVHTPFLRDPIVTQVAPPATETKEVKKAQPVAKKRRFPIWAQVLLFVLLAVAIFLIIQNMEPQSVNPFKYLPPSVNK